MGFPHGSILRLYVGGIGDGATEPDLFAAFARVGVPLVHVELVVNRATGCLRGFAFVAVAHDAAGERARGYVDDLLSRMRSAEVAGRPVTVQPIACDLGPRQVHGRTAAEQAVAESQRYRASQALGATPSQPL
jgi:RNA recognition motif-containing protein